VIHLRIVSIEEFAQFLVSSEDGSLLILEPQCEIILHVSKLSHIRHMVFQ